MRRTTAREQCAIWVLYTQGAWILTWLAILAGCDWGLAVVQERMRR